MSVEKEFLSVSRFEFERMKKMAETSLSRLSDAEFDAQISAEDNSVRIIVQHLAGNLLSRWTDFLTSDGEKSWRNRDAEFEAQQISRSELMLNWEKGWNELFKAIDSIGENQLLDSITIRNEKLSVMLAIQRQIAHYSYHTGQIVFLCKHLKGAHWQSLSIPKGKSSEFTTKGNYKSSN